MIGDLRDLRDLFFLSTLVTAKKFMGSTYQNNGQAKSQVNLHEVKGVAHKAFNAVKPLMKRNIAWASGVAFDMSMGIAGNTSTSHTELVGPNTSGSDSKIVLTDASFATDGDRSSHNVDKLFDNDVTTYARITTSDLGAITPENPIIIDISLGTATSANQLNLWWRGGTGNLGMFPHEFEVIGVDSQGAQTTLRSVDVDYQDVVDSSSISGAPSDSNVTHVVRWYPTVEYPTYRIKILSNFRNFSSTDYSDRIVLGALSLRNYERTEVYTGWSHDKSVESEINSVASDASGSYWEGQRFVNKNGFFTPDGGPTHLTTPDGYYLVSAHANFEGSTQNSTAALGLRLTGETEDDVWKKQRYSQAYGTGASDQEFFLSISRVLNLSTTRGVAFTADNSQVNMQKINFTITPV